MPKDPRVRTLVPEPHKAAKDWLKRTGVIPINHMFAVHEPNLARTSRMCREDVRHASLKAGSRAAEALRLFRHSAEATARPFNSLSTGQSSSTSFRPARSRRTV